MKKKTKAKTKAPKLSKSSKAKLEAQHRERAALQEAANWKRSVQWEITQMRDAIRGLVETDKSLRKDLHSYTDHAMSRASEAVRTAGHVKNKQAAHTNDTSAFLAAIEKRMDALSETVSGVTKTLSEELARTLHDRLAVTEGRLSILEAGIVATQNAVGALAKCVPSSPVAPNPAPNG